MTGSNSVRFDRIKTQVRSSRRIKLDRFHSPFLLHPTYFAHSTHSIMNAAKVLFMPPRLAALVCCLTVTSLFAASGSIGWYYLWAYLHIEPYKSENPRAAIIAGTQGGLCTLVFCESAYGFISLLSNQKGLIRWYLWLSWITFFLGCIATAGTALLIWLFRFGVRDCTTSSSGQVTCQDLELSLKIILTVVAALGCWILSYMPIVLRLVYSQFAVEETMYDKLDPEGQPPLPVDYDDASVQEPPEVDINPQPDHRPAVDV